MISQLLSVVLALNIIVCPFFCASGDGCCGTPRRVAGTDCGHGCDSHGGGPAGEEHSAPVDQQSDQSDPCCQCVCGGAVLKDDVLQVLRVEHNNWMAIPVSSAVVTEVFEPQPFLYRTPLSGDGTNPGRALRCRLMSLLC